MSHPVIGFTENGLNYYALPQTGAQWSALVLFWLGAIIGYITHPLCWVAIGPLCWLAILGGIARTESNFNPLAGAAEENGTSSRGIAQFNDSNVRNGMIGDKERLSPFWSGWTTGEYLQAAVIANPLWALAFRTPILNWGYARLLWTGGAGNLQGLAEAIAAMTKSPQSKAGLYGFLFWRALSLAILAPTIALAWKAWKGKMGKRGR